jgi:hypothetical protein
LPKTTLRPSEHLSRICVTRLSELLKTPQPFATDYGNATKSPRLCLATNSRKATDAVLWTIGIKPVMVKTVVAVSEHSVKDATPKLPAQRTGTKQAQVIAMQRQEGAIIAVIIAATE